MIIDFHKRFEKQYSKLPNKLQIKVDTTIEMFSKDPFDLRLKNHSLNGEMKGLRAISVTGDLRIIFEQHKNYSVVLMFDVGTHNQVY